MVELSRLKHIDPRAAWADEARHFTPWLHENAELLGEALGIDLEIEESEHPVGGFSCDLVGRDLTNNARLIVENQLEPTDHSHLGQVLTYAAGTDASTIVWIARGFREEHRQALDWLNANTGEGRNFFGIEIELVQIEGEGRAAPLFKIVSKPNEWQKEVRASTRGAVSERETLYAQFWTRFLERIRRERPSWTRASKPTTANWLGMTAPIRGCTFSCGFAMGGRLRSELYIDTGDADQNLAIFDALEALRGQLDQEYGDELAYERLEGKRACRIAAYGVGDVSRADEYDAYVDWMIDSGVRLRKALGSLTLPSGPLRPR
jgi:hypothetical protein